MLKRLASKLLRRPAVNACGHDGCDVTRCVTPADCRLDGAAAGCLRCVRVEGDGPEATRLKRLGICEGQVVEVVQIGEPMIVRAAGTQVGLSRRLAHQVSVEPFAAEAAGGE